MSLRLRPRAATHPLPIQQARRPIWYSADQHASAQSVTIRANAYSIARRCSVLLYRQTSTSQLVEIGPNLSDLACSLKSHTGASRGFDAPASLRLGTFCSQASNVACVSV